MVSQPLLDRWSVNVQHRTGDILDVAVLVVISLLVGGWVAGDAGFRQELEEFIFEL